MVQLSGAVVLDGANRLASTERGAAQVGKGEEECGVGFENVVPLEEHRDGLIADAGRERQDAALGSVIAPGNGRSVHGAVAH